MNFAEWLNTHIISKKRVGPFKFELTIKVSDDYVCVITVDDVEYTKFGKFSEKALRKIKTSLRLCEANIIAMDFIDLVKELSKMNEEELDEIDDEIFWFIHTSRGE